MTCCVNEEYRVRIPLLVVAVSIVFSAIVRPLAAEPPPVTSQEIQSLFDNIENNVFRRIRMAAISLGGEYGFWREAGWLDSVVVRGNVIEDVCQEHGVLAPQSYVLGAISVFARNDVGNKLPYWPGNRNITIEDNQIRGSAVAGIYLSAAENVRVRGNRLEGVLYHPTDQAGTGVGLDLRDPIDIRHARSVDTVDNVIVDLGRFPEAGAIPGR